MKKAVRRRRGCKRSACTLRPLRRPRFEPLEPRLVLSGHPYISEFMADNEHVRPDVDGDFSDWVEIYNPTPETIDLDGWYLTDDADDLTKWGFPGVTLEPFEHLLVFASNKDRDDPAGQLHTNFKLDRDGEYLGLVGPDGAGGVAVVHDFADAFPPQYADTSYGVRSDVTTLVATGDEARYLVPDVGDASREWTPTDPGWTAAEFDDSVWLSSSPEGGEGPTGIGYVAEPIGFDVTLYEAKVPVDDLAKAREVLANPDWRWDGVSEKTEVINYLGTGSDGRYADDNPFPGQEVGSSTNYFVVEVTGSVLIPEAGPWTFGVNSNDGFSLELTDGTNQFSMEYPNQRQSHDTLGTFWIPRAGVYDVRLVMFQYRTDAGLELFAAQGNHTRFDADTFGLVGDTAAGGLPLSLVRTDVRPVMQDQDASIWTRQAFEVADPSGLDTLALGMQYDDGFVAYLNGQEVARRNAPNPIRYNSTAIAEAPAGQPQTAEWFDLSGSLDALRAGTNVLAIHGLNRAADDGDLLVLPQLVAGGSESTEWYFATPSPDMPNLPEFVYFVEPLQFSVERGFFDDPTTDAFDVEIATDTSGTTIYYTIDGSVPSETNGTLYTGPIHIAGTTTLRAVALREGFEPRVPETHTYIFLEEVIHQPSDPDGLPAFWAAGVGADYAMDPDVVDDPRYSGTIKYDLRSIPTLSLVMDPADLWDRSGGIYSNTTKRGTQWERAASVEMIDTDGETMFQVDAGVRIQGGASRDKHILKHSFRLSFKDTFGPTKLEFPLFGDDGATDRFDTITLRGGFNDHFAIPPATYLQDRWAAETQNEMGGYAPHGTFVHLYVNGLYWGLYNPVERPDASFAAAYLGGDKSDYDAIVTRGIIDGNGESWNELRALGDDPSVTYEDYEALLDIPDFIDYMMVNQYGGNWDWPHSNWYATHSRLPGGKWRFHSWDGEGCLYVLTHNKVEPDRSWENGPGEFYLELREFPEFRELFAQRIQKHFFNGGALTPEANIERLNRLAAEIDRAIVGESARWGDGYQDDEDPPQTRDDNWVPRINSLRNTYFPQRGNIVVQQYRDAGLYPELDAPLYHVGGVYQHGGRFTPGDLLSMTAPSGASVYYTLDGSDPRGPDGNPSTTAALYAGAVPLNESVPVMARAFDGSQWSARNEAVYESTVTPTVVITEINYNPYDPTAAESAAGYDDADLFEFIELQNVGSETVSLRTVHFADGIDFQFDDTDSVSLAPGQYTLMVRDQAAFEMRYGTGLPIAGEYVGGLDNGGETLRLAYGQGTTLVEIDYRDDGNWPGWADGNGSALELIDPTSIPTTEPDRTAFLADGTNWRDSITYGGTPGAVGLQPQPATVVGRHVFYNNSYFDGDNPTANADDDDAIASDKVALQPGDPKASFANYTSYGRGINGIMVDIADLPSVPTANDFAFRVGNDDTPGDWTLMATAPDISIRPEAGVGGSTRVTLIWPDNVIEKTWLEVTVKATPTTGLSQADVFYFGNAIGETGSSPTDTMVTSVDEIGARSNMQVIPRVLIDNVYDFNRDGLVTSADQIMARNNIVVIGRLRLITVPLIAPAPDAPQMHDAVLESAAAQEPNYGENSLAHLVWLFDFDQFIQPTDDDEQGTEGAVDKLLRTI